MPLLPSISTASISIEAYIPNYDLNKTTSSQSNSYRKINSPLQLLNIDWLIYFIAVIMEEMLPELMEDLNTTHNNLGWPN